jgi:hypothetical protein
MHVLAGAVGEMAPSDVPLSTVFSEAERQHLLKGDDDPMEVVIEVSPGKSSRGWHYTPQALRKMVEHVQAKTLAGIKGHQKDDDLANQFVDPATHWIGAMWRDDKAYFRGLIDKSAPDLKRWIRAKRITQPSIFTKPVLSRVNGETHVIDLEPLGIDWAPLDRAGMPSSRVVAWGEMDAIGGAPFEPEPPGGDDTIHPDGRTTQVSTVREAIDALRENGATASQVMQGMNWRAADVLPGLIASDRRGVAEGLDQATLQHVAAGEMAKAHRPQELLTAMSLDLPTLAPLVDEPQWRRLQASDKAIGEMRATLGLPADADAAAVEAKVKELNTALATSAVNALHTSVEAVVARGEMAVPTAVRPLVVKQAMTELQPGADEAAIKAAITKAKGTPEIKPILDAGLSSVVIRPTTNGSAGEMRNGTSDAEDIGLPVRHKSI